MCTFFLNHDICVTIFNYSNMVIYIYIYYINDYMINMYNIQVEPAQGGWRKFPGLRSVTLYCRIQRQGLPIGAAADLHALFRDF